MFDSIKVFGVLAAALLVGACQSNPSFKPASFFVGGKTPDSVSGVLGKPKGKGPFPAVVILHASAGLTDNTTSSWPQYLNGLGYVTLSPDTHGSRGGSKKKWDTPEQEVDAYGALDYLANLSFVDGNRIAVIGFSAGGRTVNQRIHGDSWRRSDNGLVFRAAISFYGDCRLIDFEKRKSLPLMMLVGDHEQEDRLSDCKDNHPGTKVELHILKNAYHNFDSKNVTYLRTSRGGNQMLYSPAARQKSEELVKVFLARHLGK